MISVLIFMWRDGVHCTVPRVQQCTRGSVACHPLDDLCTLVFGVQQCTGGSALQWCMPPTRPERRITQWRCKYPLLPENLTLMERNQNRTTFILIETKITLWCKYYWFLQNFHDWYQTKMFWLGQPLDFLFHVRHLNLIYVDHYILKERCVSFGGRLSFSSRF